MPSSRTSIYAALSFGAVAWLAACARGVGEAQARQLVLQRPELRRQRAARLHRLELLAQVERLFAQQLALALLLGHLVVVVVVLVGAVGDAVADRLGVGPQPGERPEQAAEHERQQAQRGDRVASAGGGACAAIFSGSTWTIQNSTITTTGTMKITTSARMSAKVSSASPDRNDARAGGAASAATQNAASSFLNEQSPSGG